MQINEKMEKESVGSGLKNTKKGSGTKKEEGEGEDEERKKNLVSLTDKQKKYQGDRRNEHGHHNSKSMGRK